MKLEGTWLGIGTVVIRDATVSPTSVSTINVNYLVEIGKITKNCYIVKITENGSKEYFSTIYVLEENIARGEFTVNNGSGNLTLILKGDKKAKLGLSTASSTDAGIINTATTVKLCRQCGC